MPGTLAAIIIVILFIRSALEANESPLPKALIGFLSFFIPALLWTYFITPGLRDTLAHDPSNITLRLTANYAYVLVASIVSLWTWFQVFGGNDD